MASGIQPTLKTGEVFDELNQKFIYCFFKAASFSIFITLSGQICPFFITSFHLKKHFFRSV